MKELKTIDALVTDIAEKKATFIENELWQLWVTLKNIKQYKVKMHKNGLTGERYEVFKGEEKIWEFI